MRGLSASPTGAHVRRAPHPAVVVEDNKVNRLIAERFVRALGLEVDLAEDGKQGVEAVRTAQPPYDLVFMDCQMPVMDGVCFHRLGAVPRCHAYPLSPLTLTPAV